VGGSAASRYASYQRLLGEGGAVMAHDIVRIIELVICTGLAAAVFGMFAIAVIAIVHGLHTVGR
jgi:hypothetical protein